MSYNLAVLCCDDLYKDHAQKLSDLANIPLKSNSCDLSSYDALVVFDEKGVSLRPKNEKYEGIIYGDFLSGAINHRRLYGGGAGQMIAKAVTPKSLKINQLNIIDATAGMGKDAFLLASLGANLQMFERNPIVFALLEDAIKRAKDDENISPIINRMNLQFGNSIDLIKSSNNPDVIYLDPMFPLRKKTAKVKKEMSAFKYIVGQDLDEKELLETALLKAKYRVVVKRPRIAPNINNQKPSFVIEGKSSRFDIYVK